MRPRRMACLVALAATGVLAFGASTASSGSAAQQAKGPAADPAGKVGISYTVKKFVRKGNHLVAYGTATARYKPGSAGGQVSTSTKPFRAAVKMRSARSLAATQTICPVLTLDLQQLDLNLLGLVVHADRVFLTIKADSEGGLLGHLLCGLSNSGKLATQATKLNWAVKKSGLAVSGTGYTVSLPQTATAGGGNYRAQAFRPMAICPVLELTLGPLDANLLGLVVHLDQVHLTITADSEGGILGSLFCSVAGGGTTP